MRVHARVPYLILVMTPSRVLNAGSLFLPFCVLSMDLCTATLSPFTSLNCSLIWARTSVSLASWQTHAHARYAGTRMHVDMYIHTHKDPINRLV